MVIREPDTLDERAPGTFAKMHAFVEDAWAYMQTQTIALDAAERPLRLLLGLNVQAVRYSTAYVEPHRPGFSNEGNVNVRSALPVFC